MRPWRTEGGSSSTAQRSLGAAEGAGGSSRKAIVRLVTRKGKKGLTNDDQTGKCPEDNSVLSLCPKPLLLLGCSSDWIAGWIVLMGESPTVLLIHSSRERVVCLLFVLSLKLCWNVLGACTA